MCSRTIKYYFLLFAILGASKTQAQVGDLLWQDDFDSGVLNPVYWNIETGTGVNGDWGTGQLDRATDRIDNLHFAYDIPGADNGCLVITTRDEFYIDREYTSGRINTAGKVAWGPGHRIAARVYPKDVKYQGQGFAFWMMPDELPDGYDWLMWPQGGEIDIMEYVGTIPHHNLGGVHYAWFWLDNEWHDWNHGHLAAYYSYKSAEVPDPPEPGYGGWPVDPGDPDAGSSGFHVYGIDWYDDRMEFFVDSNVYHIHYLNDGGAFELDGEDAKSILDIDARRVGVSEYSNHFVEWRPFEHQMFIILSGGVGGTDHTYGGPINEDAVFPCSVYIDWVRVYELSASNISETAERQREFTVYPVPTGGLVKIQFPEYAKWVVTITDVSGRIVRQVRVTEEFTEVDVSDLLSGIYIINASSREYGFSQKLIVE